MLARCSAPASGGRAAAAWQALHTAQLRACWPQPGSDTFSAPPAPHQHGCSCNVTTTQRSQSAALWSLCLQLNTPQPGPPHDTDATKWHAAWPAAAAALRTAAAASAASRTILPARPAAAATHAKHTHPPVPADHHSQQPANACIVTVISRSRLGDRVTGLKNPSQS